MARRRLHELLTQSLIEDVVSGATPAGTWLPREVDLAARHDVSRGVARETIRALEERGIVAVRHGRGARVRPREQWDLLDPVVLEAVLEHDRDGRLAEEVLECGRLLGREVAARAAEHATAGDVRALTETLPDIRATAGVRRATAPIEEHPFVAAQVRYHAELARAAANLPLSRIVAPLDLALAVVAARNAAAVGAPLVRLYMDLLQAVATRDGEAARAAVDARVQALAGAVR